MKIQWTRRAYNERVVIFDKLANTFGLVVALHFDKRLVDFEETLAISPSIGAIESTLKGKQFEYRSFVVHRLCKVIYRVTKDTIYIVDLWDTRRSKSNLTQGIQ